MRWLQLVCALGTLAAGPTAVVAQDWDQWRGPQRDGAVKLAAGLTWPKTLTKKWQITVGEGHASPVVSDGRVYIFARQDDNEVFRALDLASGKERFAHRYPAPYKMNGAARGHGKGPKSTPMIADGHAVTLGISGILTAWDLRSGGQKKWRHEFSRRFKSTSPLYGTSMSPLLREGMCIAHVGGHNSGALTAFALTSGAKRWDWSDDGPGYTSPLVARLGGVAGRAVGGVEQLITQSQDACIAVDPESGKLLWHIPFKTEYTQNIVTPVVHGDRVIFGGYNKPTFAVQVRRSGTSWSTKEVWSNSDIPMYMSSPVASGNAFFGMTHRRSGQLFCADLRTGRAHWTGKPRLGDNAALLITDDVLLALTTGGELLVIKNTTKSYQELARYRVAETPTWAHPVVVGGDKILVKDKTTLALWSLK